jgi:hypothetical protein
LADRFQDGGGVLFSVSGGSDAPEFLRRLGPPGGLYAANKSVD